MPTIGPYEVLETIHRGPRPLYKVRASDGRLLALKTAPAAGLTAEMRERFNREAAICRELSHPNLVQVYDCGEADGVLYQAMELLHGADLSKVLAERRPLSWEEKIGIMEQVCDGLGYAHARGLVHRDIKPANLFLETSGRVRILDFGMARVAASNLTQAGSALGTLTYMAPEQIRGETCTAATDVFAAGIVFYELATGKHPFLGDSKDVARMLTAAMFQAPRPLKDLAPDAPEGLDLVLNKALEKEREKRVQNADDLRQALALCRITLKLRPRAPAPAAAGAAAEEPYDAAKTVVVKRSPAAPAATPAPKPPVAPPPPPRPAMPKLDLTFCPACTHGNPKGAPTCERCGLPLTASVQPAEPEQEAAPAYLRWLVMALAAAVVVLLLILLLR
jgi:serine/threonine protein kinase